MHDEEARIEELVAGLLDEDSSTYPQDVPAGQVTTGEKIFGVSTAIDPPKDDFDAEFPTGQAKLFKITYQELYKVAVEVGAKWRKSGFDYVNDITPETPFSAVDDALYALLYRGDATAIKALEAHATPLGKTVSWGADSWGCLSDDEGNTIYCPTTPESDEDNDEFYP